MGGRDQVTRGCLASWGARCGLLERRVKHEHESHSKPLTELGTSPYRPSLLFSHS
jgi:hypothetical protein